METNLNTNPPQGGIKAQIKTAAAALESDDITLESLQARDAHFLTDLYFNSTPEHREKIVQMVMDNPLLYQKLIDSCWEYFTNELSQGCPSNWLIYLALKHEFAALKLLTDPAFKEQWNTDNLVALGISNAKVARKIVETREVREAGCLISKHLTEIAQNHIDVVLLVLNKFSRNLAAENLVALSSKHLEAAISVCEYCKQQNIKLNESEHLNLLSVHCNLDLIQRPWTVDSLLSALKDTQQAKQQEESVSCLKLI